MYDILIRSDSRYPLDRDKVRAQVSQEMEQTWKLKGKVELSICVVGSRKMKTLNKTYRKIDKPTNVLSFPLEQSETQDSGFAFPQDKKLYLGDVVICYPVARQEAADYHMMVDDWIGELAVHGLKHLMGEHHAGSLPEHH